jgi:uncharacterized DUF497 family protein
MTSEDYFRLFADIHDFGWNPNKRDSNLRDKKIDFDDAREVLKEITLIRRSDRHGEVRYQIFGYAQGRQVSVVCTLRGSLCWIISARHASRAERRKYYNRLARLSEPRQD